MMKILRNNWGETLIEVLASILITTLSVALLFTCIMASSKIERDAKALNSTMTPFPRRTLRLRRLPLPELLRSEGKTPLILILRQLR